MDKIKADEISKFIKMVSNDEIDEEEDKTKDTFLEIIKQPINYELLLKRNEILGLRTNDDILKFQIFLQDDHSLSNFL